ncbi:hypothetical protein [Devosia sp.]|jgi:hypothetical protein|uniref:hypothetical protein n=1 Tax=Devosia sp. TaxID=1871048 RepID=UPI0037C151AF
MRHLGLALLVLPLFATPVLAQDGPAVTPEEIGQIFCMSRLGDDKGLLQGLLSDELRSHIVYAEARDASYAAAHPDDKPPLGDGIPWASFPDFPGKCSLGSIAIENGVARVVVTYDFADQPAAQFSDTLELVQAPHPYNPDRTLWRLNDIRYTTSTTLREALDSLFQGL